MKGKTMHYTKEYLRALLNHLERTNQGWCFDEIGRVWTRETVSFKLLTLTEAEQVKQEGRF